jgi:MFS superfamily sulfate permease-like transporter
MPTKMLSELEAMHMSAQDISSIQQVLTKLSPEELRSAFFGMIKQDHPDAFLLRFLRAEKWGVSEGFAKLVSALEWRTKQMQVDKEVTRKGELYALQQSQNSTDATEKKDGEDFLAQMRMGKGYFHGVDKSGRPICIVRGGLHKPGAQSEKVLNAFIVHSIEQVRLLLVPPVETMVKFLLYTKDIGGGM